jgi:hypothetical protein
MANLFSDISLGRCTRAFKSGGRRDRGAHTGRGATFWNLRCDAGKPVPLPSCDFGPNLSFVLPRWTGGQVGGADRRRSDTWGAANFAGSARVVDGRRRTLRS